MTDPPCDTPRMKDGKDRMQDPAFVVVAAQPDGIRAAAGLEYGASGAALRFPPPRDHPSQPYATPRKPTRGLPYDNLPRKALNRRTIGARICDSQQYSNFTTITFSRKPMQPVRQNIQGWQRPSLFWKPVGRPRCCEDLAVGQQICAPTCTASRCHHTMACAPLRSDLKSRKNARNQGESGRRGVFKCIPDQVSSIQNPPLQIPVNQWPSRCDKPHKTRI